MRKHVALSLILALVVCLAPACDPPKRERLVKVAGYGLQLAALLEVNRTLPDSLHAQGVITAERAAEVKAILADGAVAVAAFNAGMRDALAVESPNYAALLPLVADMIAHLQRLNVGVKSEVYRKTLATIEISLRAVASFFALQVRAARAAGYTDADLARFVRLEDVRAVERYAARS